MIVRIGFTALFLTTFIFSLAQDVPPCIEPSSFERLKKDLLSILEGRFVDRTNNVQVVELIDKIKKINSTTYLDAMQKIVDEISCDDFISSTIIELYSWHSNLHYFYLVLETIEGRFLVLKYDHITGFGEILGIIHRNYFSSMVSFILTKSRDEEITGDYFFICTISKQGFFDVEIATDADIWTINQIAILEPALFQK